MAIKKTHPLRTRSVPAPTVHRLFNGFWSERIRSGYGGEAERAWKNWFMLALKLLINNIVLKNKKSYHSMKNIATFAIG